MLDGPKGVYGYHKDTVKSIMLTLLPMDGFNPEEAINFTSEENEMPFGKGVFFVDNLLKALKKSGFNWQCVSG